MVCKGIRSSYEDICRWVSLFILKEPAKSEAIFYFLLVYKYGEVSSSYGY